jgi:hypothetical protein
LELRRLSGLTWDQLARLFVVDRRSLHFWASGKPPKPSNEERLQRVLAVIRKIDRGSTESNRAILLEAHPGGAIPLDLLTEQKYDEMLALVGLGHLSARPVLPALSATAAAARAPLAPDELAGARQEPIHQDVGKGRAARSARTKKK